MRINTPYWPLSALIVFALSSICSLPVLAEPAISFWSGNRVEGRKLYERDVLDALLAATEQEFGKRRVDEYTDDYPGLEEAEVFTSKGHDLFVTVAGNPKLAGRAKILVPEPIMKGLLGYRLLIVKSGDVALFTDISPGELAAKKVGIPETWADADLFRANGYQVVEQGSFDTLMQRLANQAFDYVSFGANEIDSVFTQYAEPVGGLTIQPDLLLHYPFALVFYLAPDQQTLARRLNLGFERIRANGVLDALFERYFGDIVEGQKLRERRTIHLDNPQMPAEMLTITEKIW